MPRQTRRQVLAFVGLPCLLAQLGGPRYLETVLSVVTIRTAPLSADGIPSGMRTGRLYRRPSQSSLRRYTLGWHTAHKGNR
jgi:hypothetical protein